MSPIPTEKISSMSSLYLKPSPILLQEGDIINGQLTVLESVNMGTFEHVWKVESRSSKCVYAMKVPLYNGANRGPSKAIELSSAMRNSRSLDIRFIALALTSIVVNERLSVVYNLYGMSLRDLLKEKHMLPLPVIHEMHHIHTDIKPGNIVLASEDSVVVSNLASNGLFAHNTLLKSPHIKIVDLDDSRLFQPKLLQAIGTRAYRAPEVHGGLGWSYGVDMFAAGCTIYELYTRGRLFAHVDDVASVLANMEKRLGPIPQDLAAKLFKINPSLFWKGADLVLDTLKIDNVTLTSDVIKTQTVHYPDLADLIKQSLSLDPIKRISSADACCHRYFRVFTPAT
ncbi:kinase-like domain-containing protein [Crepidotus variabilis]|uniref:Kinase-like domain-containing protein n=1 Tax=Crepidotus variabilis TaxID=179855 RepID=A0A9P6E816_9AGAR|nr:kinase-like domain-containing protein [Crepidotus variabilis]